MTLSWQDAETVIAQNLIMLTVEGGSGNFMIVSVGDMYVQFAGSRGLSRIQCEAVGNDYLDRQHRLSPEKIAELEKLYFVPQDAPANFAREFQVASEVHARHLAQLALNILEKIYRCERTSPVNLELTLE
jgi:hypothetical protein